MAKTITVDQLKELLQIQKDFDSRIPTLNLQDSKVAYVVEFFEWFNTLETFKNWKKNPGKPLDVQLDELADMLAFGLSIATQMGIDEISANEFISEFNGLPFKKIFDYKDINFFKSILEQLHGYVSEEASFGDYLIHPLLASENHYTIDQLITAYKQKMERNHARQDGTADTDKGYV